MVANEINLCRHAGYVRFRGTSHSFAHRGDRLCSQTLISNETREFETKRELFLAWGLLYDPPLYLISVMGGVFLAYGLFGIARTWKAG
jgi:hypothetical protein